MLTIFSCPKPFKDHDELTQRNAILSWTQLRPGCEIILLGDDAGVSEFAGEIGVRHVPDIHRNEYGTPLVNAIFNAAEKMTSNDILCYVNSDIILLSDFPSAVRRMPAGRFLMIGQRWDLEVNEPLDFNSETWEHDLRARVKQDGTLHPASGMDYFVYLKGTYQDIPSFALGRSAWDNWLVYTARSQDWPVIDATRAVTIVHQNHDYHLVKNGKAGAFRGPEARRNQALLGGTDRSYGVANSNMVLTSRGLQKISALTRLKLYHENLYWLWPWRAARNRARKLFAAIGRGNT